MCVCLSVCVHTSQSEGGNTFFVSVFFSFFFLSVSHLSTDTGLDTGFTVSYTQRNAKKKKKKKKKLQMAYIRQKSYRESNTSGRCRDLFLDRFHTFLLGPLTNRIYLFFFF